MSADASPPPERPLRPRLSAARRERLRRIVDRTLGADALWSAALVGTCLLLALRTESMPPDPGEFRIGAAAPIEVRATDDVDVVDEPATDERRREARSRVLDVYVHDVERGRELVDLLAAAFRDGRSGVAPTPAVDAPAVVQDARATLERLGFDPAIEHAATTALASALEQLVIGNRSLLDREPAILLVRIPGHREQRVVDYARFVGVEQARSEVSESLAAALTLPPADESVLAEYVASFVDANVHYDSEETHARRESAADGVPPVTVHVPRGETLVRQGQIVTPSDLERLDAANRASWARGGRLRVFGWLCVFGTLTFFAWRYASHDQRRFRKVRHLYALFVLVLLAMLLAARAVPWVVERILTGLGPPFDGASDPLYLVPFGAGAILIALLADGRVATVHAGFTTILVTLVTGGDAYAMTWSMIVQLAGIYAVSAHRERAALLRAGVVVGSIGAFAALVLDVLRDGTATAPDALYGAALAWVCGAVGVGLLVPFALPPLEWLFNVLTDARLLELSHANHPLLARLALQAPGSYNHSLFVGTLAEECAQAVGANGLLCRVAGFYHDVGKLANPEYYVENQHGTNPHDDVDPRRSAEILAGHVIDGVRMAREAGLPQQIVDMIPQHHGTRTMAYFLDKARRASSGDPPPREDDFRYPGPKPQTREAAIFMIADAVEAAARTVDEPTAPRLHEVIRQVTQAIVLERQLDECDLTFADLERVQDALLRRLVSMHHQRIEYPGYDFGARRRSASSPAAIRR
jgi:putative nucleotidyltransferase with HDIG domain